MKFKQRRELKRTKIEIIPMIDTMFFLLVFFILSSIGVIRLEGINVNLPRAQTGQQSSKPAELTVSIDNASNISINAQAVPPGTDIGPLLVQAAGANADLTQATVIISADRAVPHGLVVQCIDQARTVNISKFAIATTKTEDETSGGGATPPGPASVVPAPDGGAGLVPPPPGPAPTTP